MIQQLINDSGKPYLQTHYDTANNWVHNNWIGYQSHAGIMHGADMCLEILQVHQCAYLLNDNPTGAVFSPNHVSGPRRAIENAPF